MKASIIALATAGVALGQVTTWGQCGGNGYTGTTTCVSGTSCIYLNDWYWQCLPGTSPQSISTSATSTAACMARTTPTTLITSTFATIPSTVANPSSTGVQFLGRVNPETKELTWPGTGLRFSYNGDAQIDLTTSGSNSGDLVIDGSTTVIPTVTGSIPLPSGNHNVEFRKRSEAALGSLFLQISGTPASNRLIEFIGDSITVGYGLDGVNPCTNTAQVEDNPKTYAALAANALGADYNVIAWSGKGITRNYPGDNGPLLPELWSRYGANDADNSYTFPVQAQVIVINLGTNDFNYLNTRSPLDINSYQNAMIDFVQTIHRKYSSAKVFLMSSPMLEDEYPSTADAQHTTMSNALKDVAGTTGAYFVDWPSQGPDVACGYHPTAATHATEASVLATAIREVMGW